MNRYCKTCIHWDGPESQNGFNEGFAPCFNPKMIESGTRPDGWWISDPAYSFYTGPDFGCVHWEWES